MKAIYKGIALLAIVGTVKPAFAQKPDLTAAIMSADKSRFEEAKKYIDKSHEKLMGGGSLKAKDLSKFWYNRGVIYQNMFKRRLDTNMVTLETALASYQKEISLANPYFEKKSKQGIASILHMYRKLAIKSFDLKEFGASSDYFMKAAAINENLSQTIDTATIVNGYIAAKNGQSWDRAITISNKLLTIEETNSQYHLYKIGAYNALADEDKLFAAINDARIKCPDSQDIVLEEVNYYIARKQFDKLLGSLKEAININPNMAVLHFNIGSTYKEMGDNENAKASYLKAIEIKEDYFDAYNNLAALYLDRTNALTAEMNDLGFSSKEVAKSKKLKSQRNDIFKELIPYMEKAIEIEQDNREILTVLKEIYYKLEDMPNFKIVKSKLDNL